MLLFFFNDIRCKRNERQPENDQAENDMQIFGSNIDMNQLNDSCHSVTQRTHTHTYIHRHWRNGASLKNVASKARRTQIMLMLVLVLNFTANCASTFRYIDSIWILSQLRFERIDCEESHGSWMHPPVKCYLWHKFQQQFVPLFEYYLFKKKMFMFFLKNIMEISINVFCIHACF